MKILKQYFELQKQIYDYFGYVEDWVVIPLEDSTDSYWYLEQKEDGSGKIAYSDVPFEIEKVIEGDFYSGHIYTQRFLPKWVYKGSDYTMVCVDTRTDSNKFLQVFDNKKELINPTEAMKLAFERWSGI